MMIRRILLLFFIFSGAVRAKLMLWPSAEDINNDTKISDKKQQHIIHDRLNLYHGGSSDAAQYYATPNSISPTKYLSLMFQYLSRNISVMSEYLYSADPNKSQSSSAYTLFRHAKNKDMISEPKDVWEGIVSAFSAAKTGYFGGMREIVDGAYELGYGTIFACIALFGGGNSNSNNGLLSFFTELAKGLRSGATHTANGLYLFAVGAVVGSRNLVVGTFRTPRAMISSKLGMSYYPQGKKQIANEQTQVAVWDYYSLDYEDREIHMEEERYKEQNIDISQQQTDTDRKRGATRNIRRRARSSVKDKWYYDVLGVETNADPKEIRSAYRKEALKRHPDKQQTSLSYDSNSEANPQHIEGFLDLTEAYRILSNDESRYAYDQFGLCFREETMIPEDGSHEDYIDLIDELFGASTVQDYVGNVAIAPIVNDMFGFRSEDTSSQQSMEVQNLQQRRRIVDVAMHLRDRVEKRLFWIALVILNRLYH